VDPRNAPLYTIAEASRYLRIAPSTLTSWVKGNVYYAQGARMRSAPLITPPEGSGQLSFLNLLEAFLIEAIRKDYRISAQKIRDTQQYLATDRDHPVSLAEAELRTDGIELYIEDMGRLLCATMRGQLGMRDVLQPFLERIVRRDGKPFKLFLVTRGDLRDSPKRIEVDPRISFGRPVITGTRIDAKSISDRYMAGESPRAIAEDYDINEDDVNEAIRCIGRAA
jgi:uncharacterized protein (DUF433 family)